MYEFGSCLVYFYATSVCSYTRTRARIFVSCCLVFVFVFVFFGWLYSHHIFPLFKLIRLIYIFWKLWSFLYFVCFLAYAPLQITFACNIWDVGVLCVLCFFLFSRYLFVIAPKHELAIPRQFTRMAGSIIVYCFCCW